MSHEVETMFSRETPWHQLGTVTDRKLTAAEALVAAELDWNVTLEPLHVWHGDGRVSHVPNHMGTVRSSDNSVLGVVGTGYQPIQNEAMLTWAEALVDSGDARFVSAGSLREGRVVFCTLEVDVEVDLPGAKGQIRPYLTTASSHDGSMAFKALTSPTIVVCMNTLNMAVKNSRSSWSIKHTSSADFRLDQARRMLGLVIGYYDEFTRQAHDMIDAYVSDSAFQGLTDQLIPPPTHDTTARIRDNTFASRRRLGYIWSGATLGDFHNTAWGALNAVNEYELWYKKVKGDRAERHALRILNDDFPLTQKAQKILVNAS
jgi:phage/plasmid-like protein (TIGR03299 family)